jgi:hypothetical protein
MHTDEILQIWKTYDERLSQSLSMNHRLVEEVSHLKVKGLLSRTKRAKRWMLAFGVPYLVILYVLTGLGIAAGGFFFTVGFGGIALIITGVVVSYLYHLYLIGKIDRSETIAETQTSLSRLKISSFNVLRLALLQIPLWSICWMSLDALMQSPVIYGGVNLLVFLGLCYLTFWLYRNTDISTTNNIARHVLSGSEWDPITRSISILEQLDGENLHESR